MSDSYERIQDQAEVAFQFQRASILIEQELFFTEKQFKNPSWFPKFIHVIVPTGGNVAIPAALQWQGMLSELKGTMISNSAALEKELKTNLKSLQVCAKSKEVLELISVIESSR